MGQLRNDKESLEKHISLIGSELVLNRAVDKGNLDGMLTFKDSPYPVGELKEMLRVSPVSEETLSIVCNGPNPDELPTILAEIIGSYNSEIEKDSKNDGQKAKDYIKTFSDKLSDDKEDAETARSHLWAQLGIESTDNQGNIINPHNKKLFRLQDQYDTVRREVKEVQGRALQLAKSLKANSESGLIDETQVKISAIEAQEYLKLQRGNFQEETLGGNRGVQSLQPDMQRRQAIQDKIWDQDAVINRLKFARAEQSDVFGSGHKTIASMDKQISFYTAQRTELEEELEELEGHIEAEANLHKSQLSTSEGEEPVNLDTFRANENREWIRMYQLKLQHEQARLLKSKESLEEEITSYSRKAQKVAAGITKLNLLQNQIDEKGELVSGFVNKLSEFNILSKDKYSTTSVKVLNTPKRGMKVAPSLPKSLALGVALASLIGLGLAILVDQSELAYRNPTEIFERLQVPVVGRIPRINIRQIDATQGHASLVAAHKPSATASESFRDVRTGLFFPFKRGRYQNDLVHKPITGRWEINYDFQHCDLDCPGR